MENIDLSPNLEKILKNFERGSDLELTNAWGAYYERSKKSNIANGKIGPQLAPLTQMNRTKSGNPLADTGNLKNSIGYAANSHEVRIGAGFKYARILHEGGIISARKAKFLAIPFGYRWKMQTISAGSVRSVLAKHPFRFVGGTIKINGETAFILRKSVRIPSRPFLLLTEEDYTKLQSIYENWLTNKKGAI